MQMIAIGPMHRPSDATILGLIRHAYKCDFCTAWKRNHPTPESMLRMEIKMS